MAARRNVDGGPFALDPDRAFDVLRAAIFCGDAAPVVVMNGEDAASRPLATFHTPEAAPAGETTKETPERPAAFSAAATEAELLDIFRDCLGYDRELTRGDDFFELGGDSIAATRVTARIDKELGIRVGVLDLLESDTLGGFMDKVLADGGPNDEGAATDLPPAPERDAYPVGREQLSILYADMIGEGGLGFNLPAFLLLPRDLDRTRLEEAITVLIQRHDVLRTSFRDFDAPHPNMVVHPFEGFTLKTRRIPDLSAKDALITPFDLRRGPSSRFLLLVTDAGENVLYLDIHHALADGRTISLFNAELYALYHGLALPPVSAQMKDFAWWQFTRDNEADRAYWLARFPGEPPTLDLPADYDRPPALTGRGGMYEFELPADLVAGVKALARREGVTNYHVTLAAWSLLVHASTGAKDFVIAVSVDSRGGHLNTAGMLASLLPLRFAVDDAASPRALLRHVRDVSNEALRHGGYILHDLLADLKPTARLDRSPLSEVILSYMNFEFASGEARLFEPLHFGKQASKTDLSIFASDTGQSIGFALEYYADLFSEADVARMARDFTRILELLTSGGAEAPVPFVRTPPARRDIGSARRETGRALSEGLRRVARDKGASEAAAALATFAALFARLTSRREFAMDVPGRGRVRFAVDEDTEFDDLLRRTDAELTRAGREALNDGGIHFGGSLTGDAQPDAPRPRAAFSFSGPDDAPEPDAARLDATHDLICRVRDDGDALLLRLDHDRAVLDAPDATKWLGHYQLFLEEIAKGSDR